MTKIISKPHAISGTTAYLVRITLLAALTLSMLPVAQADDHGYRGGDRGGRWHAPYDHRFFDGRHHHNRYYPTPGYFVGALPPRHVQVVFRGARYFFSDGIWFHGDGGRFVVVAPPLGIGIRVLPHIYTSLWIGGMPYYYANNVYYLQTPQGYVVSQPPADQTIVEAPASTTNNSTEDIVEQPANAQISQAPVDLYVYPAHGQSEKQLAADRNECHAWAVKKSGYDPYNASSGFQIGQKRVDYERAFTACLEGRGYTVK